MSASGEEEEIRFSVSAASGNVEISYENLLPFLDLEFNFSEFIELLYWRHYSTKIEKSGSLTLLLLVFDKKRCKVF